MRWQFIVKYLELPSKFSRNCHKKLVYKNYWHDQREKFVKRSLRDRLVFFADFVRKTLLCFLLSPIYFLNVRLPTLFAALVIFFLPFKTSAISDAANSIESAPTIFVAGPTYITKNGNAVLRLTCAISLNLFPCCWPIRLDYATSTCLVVTNVSFVINENWKLFWTAG